MLMTLNCTFLSPALTLLPTFQSFRLPLTLFTPGSHSTASQSTRPKLNFFSLAPYIREPKLLTSPFPSVVPPFLLLLTHATLALNLILISPSKLTYPISVAPLSSISVSSARLDPLLTTTRPFFSPIPWFLLNLITATLFFSTFLMLPSTDYNLFKILSLVLFFH